MNAVNTMGAPAPAQLSGCMPSELREPKFTASDIEESCPARLQELGREITGRMKEAQEYTRRLDDHVSAISKMLAEARELCDRGGFDAFREKFFPQLRKSRVYELLAIATNKKSIEGARAINRERVAKYRAKKAAAPLSITVMENSAPRPKPQSDAKHDDTLDHFKVASEQTLELSKPKREVVSGDEDLLGFTGHVMELNRRTKNRSWERFSATAVPVEVLARLGKLFTDLATFKRGAEINAMAPGNATGSSAQPLEMERPAVEPVGEEGA